MSQGRIIKALAGFYYVEDDHQIIQCRARGNFVRMRLSPWLVTLLNMKSKVIMMAM